MFWSRCKLIGMNIPSSYNIMSGSHIFYTEMNHMFWFEQSKVLRSFPDHENTRDSIKHLRCLCIKLQLRQICPWMNPICRIDESFGFCCLKCLFKYFNRCHVLNINLKNFILLFFCKTCWYTRSGWRINHYIVLKITIMCWKLWSSSTCCMSQSHLNKLMPLYNKPVNYGCWSQTVGNWLLKSWVKLFAHQALFFPSSCFQFQNQPS